MLLYAKTLHNFVLRDDVSNNKQSKLKKCLFNISDDNSSVSQPNKQLQEKQSFKPAAGTKRLSVTVCTLTKYIWI